MVQALLFILYRVLQYVGVSNIRTVKNSNRPAIIKNDRSSRAGCEKIM
jgi:hypothetical protein